MIVLDTHIIIYFLEGRLDEPLDPGPVLVSVISEIELLSHERLDDQSIAAIEGFLAFAEVVGLEPGITQEAIQLRRRHRLTVPDVIIAATAIARQATLLTNDAQLLSIADVPSRSLRLRN